MSNFQKYKFQKIKNKFYDLEVPHFISKATKQYYLDRKNKIDKNVGVFETLSAIDLKTFENKLFRDFQNLEEFMYEYFWGLGNALKYKKLEYKDNELEKAIEDYDALFFTLIRANIENYQKTHYYQPKHLESKRNFE